MKTLLLKCVNKAFILIYFIFYPHCVLSALNYSKFDLETKQTSIHKIYSLLENEAFSLGVDFSKARSILSGYDYEIQQAQTPEELANVLNMAFEKFGVTHLFVESHHEVFYKLFNNRVLGFHMLISSKGIQVFDIDPSSDAYQKGLRDEDIISLNSLNINKLFSVRNSDLFWKITFNSSVRSELTLRLPIVEKASAEKSFRWIDSNTALLGISTFGYNYDPDSIESLLDQIKNARTIVLDLRGNLGGLKKNLIHFSNLTMPSDFLLGGMFTKSEFYKNFYSEKIDEESLRSYLPTLPENEQIKTEPNVKPIFNGKWIILIDSKTASAAEIIAQGLRDSLGPEKCRIYGTSSAGAVLKTSYRPVDEFFCISLPSSVYITCNGKVLEKNGIKPDQSLDFKNYTEDQILNQILNLSKVSP